MKIIRFCSFAILCTLFFSCEGNIQEDRISPVPEDNKKDVGKPATIPGVMEVRFSDEQADQIASSMGCDKVEGIALTRAFTNGSANGISELVDELGVVSISRIFPDAGEWEPRHRKAGLHKWYRLTYADTIAQTRASGLIEKLPGVEEIEIPRKIVPVSIPFNDPFSKYQWNLFNNGKLLSGFVKGVDINVVPVWENYTTGSNDVIVAVVDSGVDGDHPDLEGVVIPAGEDGSKCFVNGQEGYKIIPGSHGTHVAGIIGAINNNGIGISSVAGGQDGKGGVRILSCQMMAEDPKDPDSTIGGNSSAAIVWGADHGAVISQNSWGYLFKSDKDAKAGGITGADKAAVDYFVEYAGLDANGNQIGPMKGGVVFFAAGNDNRENGWPAKYENVVAVGAIGPNGKKATYSNYGDWVDICAPGGDYTDFQGKAEALIISSADNSYYFMAGTSQACPHVSGAAALLLSYYGGPGFTNKDLLDKLIYGANWSARSAKSKIGPQLDVYGAFNSGEVVLPQISTDYTGDYVLKSHETLTVDYTLTPRMNVPMKVDFKSGSTAASYRMKDDNTLEMKIEALKAEPGKYSALITASQGERCRSDLTIEYEILENHPPTVIKELSGMVSDEIGSRLDLDMSEYIKDADGEVLNYTVESSVSNVASFEQNGNTLTIISKTFGTTEISINASDARGSKCTLPSFTFVVYDTSVGFSAWPVPVKDVLNLHSGTEKEMSVTINGYNGAKVFDEKVKASVFSPAKINLGKVAPGMLELSVSYDGHTYKRTIVKR
mgnify:CR=1 FL=1